MSMTLMEPIGTNPFVKKDRQVKFYVPSPLMKRCEEIFERQGVDTSEGMTGLVRLLVEAPDDAVGLLLGQAPGSAAVTLALGVLRQAGAIPAAPNEQARAETRAAGSATGEGKPPAPFKMTHTKGGKTTRLE